MTFEIDLTFLYLRHLTAYNCILISDDVLLCFMHYCIITHT